MRRWGLIIAGSVLMLGVVAGAIVTNGLACAFGPPGRPCPGMLRLFRDAEMMTLLVPPFLIGLALFAAAFVKRRPK